MTVVNDGCGGDDSEDDDDIVIGVGEDFRKSIDALKRACLLEVGQGGYIPTPASILSGNNPRAWEEDEDEEEEDDDELFLSIRSKYGSFGGGESPYFGKNVPRAKKADIVASEAGNDDEEADDEEILRSVEKLYNSGVDREQQGHLPDVVSPAKERSQADPLKGDEKIPHRSPSPPGTPVYESGSHGDWGDWGDGLSPELPSETPGEQVGTSIASFLPGNWMDTDGDADNGQAGPAGSMAMVATEQVGDDLSSPRREAIEYSRPERADVLTDALKKNRHCQRTLTTLLGQVEAKERENAELLKRARSLVDFEKYCGRRFAGFFTDQANPSVKLIAAKVPAPPHKAIDSSNKTVNDVQTCGPPENSDMEIFRKLQKKISFNFQTRRWSNEERLELARGVRQQVYEVSVRDAMDTLSNAALSEDFISLEDHMSKIAGQEPTPQQIRDGIPGIDWSEVARLYVVGRTPEECLTRWINHEDYLINKRPWQKIEDKKLLSIAQQHNFCNWEEIAEQLGTRRTPAECLTRYQRSLNASIMRSNWTKEEDGQLRAAVKEWGESDWSVVAACLEGRNNSQCLMRWYKVLHPTKKKRGRWSVEEDKRLKWAVSVYGPKKWKQIAEHVPGRTDLQCRERWCNVLDPSIKLGEWTEDEDRILEESLARHGPHRWAAVANDLKIRTDNQCCRRWKFLHPEDQPEFQRTVHIRRTALVGNFQGRKKERPRLGPQDFIAKGKDFDVYAKKPAGKRPAKEVHIGKDKQRKDALTQNDDDIIDYQSTAADDARERRAARIQKRRLARAKKASQDARATKTPQPARARRTPLAARLKTAPQNARPKNAPRVARAKKTPQDARAENAPQEAMARKTPQEARAKEAQELRARKAPQDTRARKTPQDARATKSPQDGRAKRTPQMTSGENAPQDGRAKKTPQEARPRRRVSARNAHRDIESMDAIDPNNVLSQSTPDVISNASAGHPLKSFERLRRIAGPISGPLEPCNNEVMELNNVLSQSTPDVVSTVSAGPPVKSLLGLKRQAREGLKRKAGPICGPVEPCNGRKRAKRSALLVAAPLSPSEASGKRRKRKADQPLDSHDPYHCNNDGVTDSDDPHPCNSDKLTDSDDPYPCNNGKPTKLKVRRLDQSRVVSAAQETSPILQQSVGLT